MSRSIATVKTTLKLKELALDLEKRLTHSIFFSCPTNLKRLEVETDIFFNDSYYDYGKRVNVTLVSSDSNTITLQGKNFYGSVVEYYVYRNPAGWTYPNENRHLDIDHLELLEKLEELVITLPNLLERIRIQQQEELCAELEADIMGY
jgi:hypothetical protein